MMAMRVRTWGREAGGWSLLSLAIVFFPLPFVPSLLLLAGLLILSSRYAWAKHLLKRMRAFLGSPAPAVTLPQEKVVTP
jgi:Putative transmembrane protein (PGPGW)